MSPGARAAPYSSVGCSHVGRAHLGSAKQGCACRAGSCHGEEAPVEKQGGHGWPNPLGTQVPVAQCCALPWRLFLRWWIQRTIKPLSLRLPGPIQLGMKQCRLFGCCLINSAAAVAVPEQLRCGAGVPALFGVPILVTSPGMCHLCPTPSTAGCMRSCRPALSAVRVVLITGIKFP